MGVFSNMRETNSTQGGNYIRPGNYVTQIQRCKLQESSKPGNKKQFYIAELLVIESDQTDEAVKPNAKGEKVSMVVEVPGEYPELSLGNIKAFLLAAYSGVADTEDIDRPGEDDIGEEETEESYSEENPLAGMFVQASAFHKKTQKGNLFTRINWGVPENLAALIEEHGSEVEAEAS